MKFLTAILLQVLEVGNNKMIKIGEMQLKQFFFWSLQI